MICTRCGTELKVVIVRVPVTTEELVRPEQGLDGFERRFRYEEREETADCVRCTGGY